MLKALKEKRTDTAYCQKHMTSGVCEDCWMDLKAKKSLQVLFQAPTPPQTNDSEVAMSIDSDGESAPALTPQTPVKRIFE